MSDEAKVLKWAVRKLATEFRRQLHATSCREYDPEAYLRTFRAVGAENYFKNYPRQRRAQAVIWCSCGASKRLQRAIDAAKRLK